jgi:acylphosphatase
VPELIRRRVVVSGAVQGVFFRASCRAQADRLGVYGWVRNVDDGTVEAVFEGQAEAVQAMAAWCRRGPSGARVDRVDVLDEPPRGLTGFEITGEAV